MSTYVVIPRSEWEAASRLWKLLAHDETHRLGQVRLRCNGDRRRWYATDSVATVIVDGEHDDGVFDVGLSPALIEVAATSCRFNADVRLKIGQTRPNPMVGVISPTTEMWVDDLRHDYPDIDATIPDQSEWAARCTISVTELSALVGALGYPREQSTDAPSPSAFQMGVFGDRLVVLMEWRGCGVSTLMTDCHDPHGGGSIDLDPGRLESLLEFFPDGSDIEVIIPSSTNSPALLRGSGVTALLKPRPSGFPNPLTELEDLLETVCGRTARFADSSGTYLLRQTPTPIRGRVRAGGSPMSLAVHAVVLDGIESSGELLGELNDLNTSTSSARVFHRDRQVIAQVDLPLHGLDAHALRAAIGLVDDIAAHVMPTLATVFGGSLGGDAGTEPVRRPDTTVYAEVVPGTMTVLNGPNADAWPFPAAVHVITARTVHGSPRSADTNHRIRRAISVDIVERGARFVDGEAYTSADEVGEPCLVAWGLSRSAVVAIARRAGQGSIFEIDADEVRLVSCLDETTLSWPRIAGRQAD